MMANHSTPARRQTSSTKDMEWNYNHGLEHLQAGPHPTLLALLRERKYLESV